MDFQPDEIGKWSEIKLEIIRAYATAYSQILAKQPTLYHAYVDGFAGAGFHISKDGGRVINGSPINVASVEPRFKEYHLCELDTAKAEHLRTLFRQDPAFRIHEGDCNIILQELLPKFSYDQYRRAFCLLDPYGLQLDWAIIELAGRLRSIDLLLHFPIMDMNRNVLRRDRSAVHESQPSRMSRFWGDESWIDAAYDEEPGLFGAIEEKTENEVVARAFRERLEEAAGFQYVAEPLPMKNSTNAVVYYLFFASQNKTAHKIISSIFNKHRS